MIEFPMIMGVLGWASIILIVVLTILIVKTMQRYYYNNWLAKILLSFTSCHTIAIAWFVLSKREESRTDQTDRNHETIHALQWTETTMAAGVILFFLLLAFECSPWVLVAAPLAYYVWYVLEWVCKIPFGNAYKSISFEQEAYANQGDTNYCENRCLFCGWIKKVFKVLKK